jgi:SAM-dependent methyltransferase
VSPAIRGDKFASVQRHKWDAIVIDDIDPNGTQLSRVRDYYSDKVTRHGTTAAGVDWGSEEKQSVRFRQLVRGFDDEPFSVLDVGCGYGALWDFLKAQGREFTYHGVDLSDQMIASARALHLHASGCTFAVGSLPEPGFDYVVASGIFNVTLGIDKRIWESYVQKMLSNMFVACRKGLAANFLTSYSDPHRRDEKLFYADPAAVLDYCITKLSPNVDLSHHYGLWDFTIHVRKL